MKNGRVRRRIRVLLAWLAVAAAANLATVVSSSSTPSSILSTKPIVVRVRLPDGTMERVAVDSLDVPLCDVLRGVCPAPAADDEDEGAPLGPAAMEVRVGTGTADDPPLPLDDPRSLSELRVRHGSLLTLVRRQSGNGDSAGARAGGTRRSNPRLSSKQQPSPRRWDPFPDLAKDYRAALAQYEKKKRSRTTTSYSDLSDLQAQMHVVEPQPEGPLRRVYLCRICAERFNVLAQQTAKQKQQGQHKAKKKKEASKTVEAAVLFGVIARERVDPKHRPKTSLSSTTEAQEYCQAAHVHAMWVLPSEMLPMLDDSMDSANSSNDEMVLPKQVADVAAWLGLRAVGWLFAYQGEREEGVPVHAPDVLMGATLQIDNMKKLQGITGNEDTATDHPAAFVTLAMDAESGATEAFQLSDVAVQMVAERILSPKEDGRVLSSRHPVAVDGKETNEVDSLLCLVNTALLSRDGNHAGPPASGGKVVSQVKKAGGLTAKAQKSLARALLGGDEQDLMRLLSDVSLLVALHDLMGPDDCRAICTAVRKWTRLKRGASLDAKLKDRLRKLVEGA
jgi:hypothetical protein